MNALKRYSRTLFCSVGLIVTALVAGCGGGGDQGRDPILGLPAATLVSVAVTPATPSIAISAGQQFVAVASYTDGSSRDVTTLSAWTSATPAVATVTATGGLATGVSAGTSVITATFSGKSGTAVLTVRPATLLSIALSPLTPAINIATSQPFTVTGTFSDGTTRDVTALSTFASAVIGVGTVNPATGLALGVSAGTSLITATSGGMTATTLLTVNPTTLVSIAVAPQAPTLLLGATRQLVVTATWSNGTTTDVTNVSTYATGTCPCVSVSSVGLLKGIAVGSTVVTATFSGKTATTTPTVLSTTLSSIVVTPANATVTTGGTQQFVATGTFSDGSTAVITSSVAWTSGNNLVATVVTGGVATGVAPGTTAITATSGVRSGSATLDVIAGVVPPPVLNPVNLRTAANFAVLAGTSITNNSGGTTLVTGDVGSPSQTTDPTQAAGFTNYKSGAILDGALADLQTAITDANGRTCSPVSSPSGVDLGGLVLVPGVYCYAGSISITGTLILSGPGVYIFRTTTTLDTTANSVIQLAAGATADNITWVPVGAATLGANSVFKGSILGQSGAITAGDNATLLNGRVLSGAAVTLRNNQITK
jgi:hypothetical protein